MSALLTGIATTLLPILAKSGAKILTDIVARDHPAAAEIITKVAQALGIAGASPTETTKAIADEYARNPEATAAVIRQVEENDREYWRVMRDMTEQTHRTWREEIDSEDPWVRRWRPLYAYELTGECALTVLTAMAMLLTGHSTELIEFLSVPAMGPLLSTYFIFRFGVLGVYAGGRSGEKIMKSWMGVDKRG